MITIKNYSDKIKEYDLSKAPEAVHLVHAKFDRYAAFYGKSENITEMLDNHIILINELPKKTEKNVPKTVIKKATSSKSLKNVTKKTKSAPSKVSQVRIAEIKAKHSKRPKTTPKPKCGGQTTKLVESFSDDIRLIRRFSAAIGKERQRRSVLNIYRDVERRAVERKIGQNSPYADILNEIQNRLKKAVDFMDKNSQKRIKLEAAKGSEAFYDKVTKIAKSTGLRTSALLLKRFIGIEGEHKPGKEKVQSIFAAFESALSRGKVCENDMYWKEFNEAKGEMQKYLKGDIDKIGLSPQSLNGLEGIGLGKPKATALNGSSNILNISTIDFRKMNKSELKEFTLKYYKENLKGRTIEIPNILKEVKLSSNAGRKLTYGEAMYPEKAAIIPKLEQLIKKSTYNNFGIRKEKDNKEIIGYLNFKSKLTIDGVKRHVRISIELRKNRDTYFKNAEVGKKNANVLKAHTKSSNPTSNIRNSSIKDTKKSNTNKLSGVENKQHTLVYNRFEVDIPNTAQSIQESTPIILPEIQKEVECTSIKKTDKSSIFTPISQAKASTKQITLPGDLGKFLGYVERNEYSIVLRGDKGAGKSRMTYQMMNTFAQAGFTCGCFSLEIGKDTNIVESMRNEYIYPNVTSMIHIAETCADIKDVEEAAKAFDVVVIDSWGKIPNVKPEHLDMLRKKYKSTMFIFIFQSTTNGTARGGSSSEYDAGMVIQIDTGGIAFCEKNRYSGENHKFLVFKKRLMTEEEMKAA